MASRHPLGLLHRLLSTGSMARATHPARQFQRAELVSPGSLHELARSGLTTSSPAAFLLPGSAPLSTQTATEGTSFQLNARTAPAQHWGSPSSLEGRQTPGIPQAAVVRTITSSCGAATLSSSPDVAEVSPGGSSSSAVAAAGAGTKRKQTQRGAARAKSRFKFGVYWDEASQAWGACCRAGGQSAQAIELGIFDLEEHAARAYDIARLSMSTNKYVRYYLNYSAGDYEQVGLSEWVYAPKESADDQPLMSTDQFASAIQDSRANDSTNARTSPSKTPSLSTSKSKSPSTHKAPTRKSDSLSSALMRRADRHAAAPATSLQTVHYPKTKWKRREARDAELAKLQAETQRKRPRFSDRLHVEARGGAGGSGCASLWGSSAKGANQPADGGSGGQGGNVIFEANDRVKSLRGVPKLVRADNGKPGGKQNRRGHRGQDRIVQVPVGTVISKHLPCGSAEGEEEDYPIYDWMKNPNEPWIGARDYRSSDEEDAADGGGDARPLRRPAGMEVIADLVEPGERVLVATGGEGGRGNAVMRRKGGNKPASMESEAGVQGETVRLLLELKVLADVGLVGLPNAGKSTLLRAISAARPKVASYAFTTLEPHLGTVQYPGGESIVVADIPGLIAGASKNRGLGHNFLRHIERTRALVFVLDLQRNENPSKLWDQLAMLQDELSLFHGELLERPALIAVNKCDEPLDSGSASFRAMQRLRTLVKLPVVGISAAHGHGIDDLVADLRLLVGNGSGVYAHRDFGDKAEAAAHQGGRKSA